MMKLTLILFMTASLSYAEDKGIVVTPGNDCLRYESTGIVGKTTNEITDANSRLICGEFLRNNYNGPFRASFDFHDRCRCIGRNIKKSVDGPKAPVLGLKGADKVQKFFKEEETTNELLNIANDILSYRSGQKIIADLGAGKLKQKKECTNISSIMKHLRKRSTKADNKCSKKVLDKWKEVLSKELNYCKDGTKCTDDEFIGNWDKSIDLYLDKRFDVGDAEIFYTTVGVEDYKETIRALSVSVQEKLDQNFYFDSRDSGEPEEAIKILYNLLITARGKTIFKKFYQMPGGPRKEIEKIVVEYVQKRASRAFSEERCSDIIDNFEKACDKLSDNSDVVDGLRTNFMDIGTLNELIDRYKKENGNGAELQNYFCHVDLLVAEKDFNHKSVFLTSSAGRILNKLKVYNDEFGVEDLVYNKDREKLKNKVLGSDFVGNSSAGNTRKEKNLKLLATKISSRIKKVVKSLSSQPRSANTKGKISSTSYRERGSSKSPTSSGFSQSSSAADKRPDGPDIEAYNDNLSATQSTAGSPSNQNRLLIPSYTSQGKQDFQVSPGDLIEISNNFKKFKARSKETNSSKNGTNQNGEKSVDELIADAKRLESDLIKNEKALEKELADARQKDDKDKVTELELRDAQLKKMRKEMLTLRSELNSIKSKALVAKANIAPRKTKIATVIPGSGTSGNSSLVNRVVDGTASVGLPAVVNTDPSIVRSSGSRQQGGVIESNLNRGPSGQDSDIAFLTSGLSENRFVKYDSNDQDRLQQIYDSYEIPILENEEDGYIELVKDEITGIISIETLDKKEYLAKINNIGGKTIKPVVDPKKEGPKFSKKFLDIITNEATHSQ